MKTFTMASGMKLKNILPLTLLISGHFCVNATETESSDVDGKSQEESKRDSKCNYLFLKGFHFPLLKAISYKSDLANPYNPKICTDCPSFFCKQTRSKNKSK